MTRVGTWVLLLAGCVLAVLPGHAQVRPLGATSALAEITALRTENARLEAMLIDRDRQIANIRYELGKRLLETQADLDEARLNRRAEGALIKLRELLKPPADAQVDWSTGRFVTVTPKPKLEGEKK